jgi:hypothetical protein
MAPHTMMAARIHNDLLLLIFIFVRFFLFRAAKVLIIIRITKKMSRILSTHESRSRHPRGVFSFKTKEGQCDADLLLLYNTE